MKAYKSINFSFETKAVISYAVVLSFISFFIMLSPVFAQQEDEFRGNKPKAEIDVNKQYDENGSISGCDSSFSWTWKGENFPLEDLDSIFNEFHSKFDISWNRYFVHPSDSFNISHLNFDKFEKYFYQNFDIDKYLPDENFYKEYLPDEQFLDQLGKKHDDFIDRYNEYLKEHQKLIEKYFQEPFYKKEENPEVKPNKNIQNKKSQSGKKTGRA